MPDILPPSGGMDHTLVAGLVDQFWDTVTGAGPEKQNQ